MNDRQKLGPEDVEMVDEIDACYALPMKHKGIEYAVRARPGPHQWVWTILPKGATALLGQFVGTKERASADACRAIDRWLERQRAKPRRQRAPIVVRAPVAQPARRAD